MTRKDVELGKPHGRLIFAIPFRNEGVEEDVEKKVLGVVAVRLIQLLREIYRLLGVDKVSGEDLELSAKSVNKKGSQYWQVTRERKRA